LTPETAGHQGRPLRFAVLGRNGGDESVGCCKIANVHPEKWSIV
jgi:hypothetical protein